MILGLTAIAVLMGILVLGIPIGFGMLIVGTAGFAMLIGLGPAMSMAGQTVFDVVMTDSLSVLPLFVLMGHLISASRLAEDLYASSNAFIGHLRGGLAHATILASGVFAAVSGSSLATTATMGRVALPVMRLYGYRDDLASASVAAGGTLGILIPPSVVMVIYGIMTGTNIGALFIAGILPGLLGILLYMGAVSWIVARSPESGPPAKRIAWTQRLNSLRMVAPILALILAIIGGIYLGVFTATEAAGIGAFGALIIALVKRSLTWPKFLSALADTAATTSVLFMVLIGAVIFGNFLEVAHFTSEISDAITRAQLGQEVVLLAMIVVFVLLGCFLESLSIILLAVPVFFPIMTGLGYDAVWLGVLVVILTEVALITPPIGMNVFVLRSVQPEVALTTIYRGLLPFIAADVFRIGLICFVPGIALVLPNLM